MPNRNMIDPRTLPQLFAWYDANHVAGYGAALPPDATALAQWNDISGNGRHLVQAVGANQPLLKTNILNGLSIVRFADATDTLQAVVAGLAPRPVTIIAVFKNSEADDGALNKVVTFNAQRIGLGLDWAVNNAFAAVDDNAAPGSSGVAGDVTTFHIASFVAKASGGQRSSELSVDGRLSFLGGVSGVNTNSNVDVGLGFIGDVAEILIFTGELSHPMVYALEQSLAMKWGLLGAQRYIAIAGTVPLPGLYVTTAGGTGTCSITDPCSLAHAAGGAGGLAVPGTTIWMAGGTYVCNQLSFSLSGTAANPIVFRSLAGQRVTLQGVAANLTVSDINVDGNYLWFWGLEATRLWTTRTGPNSGATGFYVRNSTNGVKFIHPVIHDVENGIYTEKGVGAVEIYGPIIYNAGSQAGSQQGHGFYLHHDDNGGTADLLVEHAISFNHFGAAFQAYSSTAADHMDGIKVRYGIFFNAGVLTNPAGGSTIFFGADVAPTTRCEITDTVCHWPSALPSDQHLYIGQTGVISNSLDVQRNYLTFGGKSSAFAAVFIKGRFVSTPGAFKFKNNFMRVVTPSGKAVYVAAGNVDLAGYDWVSNTWIRDPTTTSWYHSDGTAATFANWKTATGLGGTDTATATDPSVTMVVVIPTTRYEAGRGHIWYYNWASLTSIPADLSSILQVGDNYTIHDVRDVFGSPVVSGVYAGGTVNLPNTQVADPAVTGGSPNSPPATAPFFNAFLVRKV